MTTEIIDSGFDPAQIFGPPMNTPHESQDHATRVTPAGAAWLASAGTYPRSTLAQWQSRPDAPSVVPCGSVFDVVNVPAVFGRRMLDRLWDEGPGSGPVAVHRGRMLLFAAPGTGTRLPALLAWEECGTSVPPLLCHGIGDAVTVPPVDPGPPAPAPFLTSVRTGPGSPASAPRPSHLAPLSACEDPAPDAWREARWLVAPGTRHPWLPGPDVLRWACVRAARAAVPISIFPGADPGAKVYDVTRRR